MKTLTLKNQNPVSQNSRGESRENRSLSLSSLIDDMVDRERHYVSCRIIHEASDSE